MMILFSLLVNLRNTMAIIMILGIIITLLGIINSDVPSFFTLIFHVILRGLVPYSGSEYPQLSNCRISSLFPGSERPKPPNLNNNNKKIKKKIFDIK